MSAFHEAIKQILADVNRFLNSTLRDENLSKSAQKGRAKILESLQKLYEEFEVLNPGIDEGSSNSSKDESRFTSGSTHSHGSHGSEEDGSVDNIPYTTVKALVEPTKLGYLQKKPTDLLEKFSKQKKYCVIHKNIMYWFKKHNDKKHQGAIFLTGYEFKDLTQNDKEFVFELASSKKKCLQFQADSKEDLEEWRKAVEIGIKFVEPIEDIVEEGDSGEEYEPIDEVAQAVRNKQAASNSSTTNTISATKPPTLPSKTAPLPATPQSPPPQEEYADGFSMPIEIAKAEGDKKPAANTAINSPVVNNPPVLIGEDFEQEDDNLIYEFVESPPLPTSKTDSSANQTVDVKGSSVPDIPPPRPLPAQPLPPPPSSSMSLEEPPPLPSRGANLPLPPRSPLPEPPISASTPPKSLQAQKTISPNLDINVKTAEMLAEDYENFFYGLFTCIGDSNNELSFDRGDVIHILNRDLDPENWWIGESYGKVGLVPKEFLTPVYEMLA